MPSILILNGPNLNMLGIREPAIYGSETLADIKRKCQAEAKALGLKVDFRQSNHEGELVTWIQKAYGKMDGIILNAGAYTHTSIAIHDALKAVGLPVIEVHLSNPHERESFRHVSYVAPVAADIITGKRGEGYVLALRRLKDILKNKNS